MTFVLIGTRSATAWRERSLVPSFPARGGRASPGPLPCREASGRLPCDRLSPTCEDHWNGVCGEVEVAGSVPDARTRFGPDDEPAFIAASGAVVDSYRAVASRRPDADPFVASVMLDFKWAYGDGRIFEWRRADLDDLLLSYFPRKVTVPDEDLLGIVPAAKDFLAFLEDGRALGGDPLPELIEGLDALLPDFAAAMHDASSFGMAKGIVAAMKAAGVDISRPDAMSRWIEELNGRPMDERVAILGAADSEPLVVRSIELPGEDELVRAAEASGALARLAGFARYVGDGRRLTQRGFLALSDARALVDLLETGDEIDPVIGGRVFGTRSSAELPALGLVFRWARAAGFVKVRRGWVSITRRGMSLGKKATEDWRAAFDGFLTCDPVPARYGLGASRHGPSWNEILVELIEQLPVGLYIAGEVDLEQLRDDAWRQVQARFELHREAWVLDHWRRMMEIDIDRQILGNLSDLGAITISDGKMSPTSLGLWATNRILRDQGAVAPVVGEHAGSSAADLLRACAELSLDEAELEIRRWIDRRPLTAARELAEVARSGPLPMLALHALGFAGPAAEAEVRALVEVKGLEPRSRMWLVEHGHEDPSSLPSELLLAAFVAGLAAEAQENGPVSAVARLMSLGPEPEQVRYVEQLLRADDPAAAEVLEMIGRYHPSKAVARTARRTAFKRRSFGLH